MCEFIDTFAGTLGVADRTFLFLSPFPWRDVDCTDFLSKLLIAYQESYIVPFAQCVEGSGFLENLEQVEKMAASADDIVPPKNALTRLESLHRILGLYSWLHMRKPVAFCNLEEVSELKPRVEAALVWALRAVSRLKLKGDDHHDSRSQIQYTPSLKEAVLLRKTKKALQH